MPVSKKLAMRGSCQSFPFACTGKILARGCKRYVYAYVCSQGGGNEGDRPTLLICLLKLTRRDAAHYENKNAGGQCLMRLERLVGADKLTFEVES